MVFDKVQHGGGKQQVGRLFGLPLADIDVQPVDLDGQCQRLLQHLDGAVDAEQLGPRPALGEQARGDAGPAA
ncbi:hypothetical protein D3C81_2218470 [compost metagenome]